VKQEKITRFISTENADRKWYLVDAQDVVLGRMATEVAKIIRGKNKAIFTPNMDTGDFVVVINADKVKLTGKRETLKTYVRHSGYPGGQKVTTFQEMMEKKPEFVIQNAVKGMLPKNRLGRKLIKKLKVYAGESSAYSTKTRNINSNGEIMTDKIYIGRRKTSVARVILRNGNGKVTVNKREFEKAFPQLTNRDDILAPLKLTETDDKYDVFVNVNGGGTTGQAQSIRLGIARALIDINPDFRPKLKIEGYLKRDPRMVERKKYGQPKARKRFQFSKR
jgi:ribosomal protein L13